MCAGGVDLLGVLVAGEMWGGDLLCRGCSRLAGGPLSHLCSRGAWELVSGWKWRDW